MERTHSIQGNASSRNVCKIADSMKNAGWQGDPVAVVEHGESLLVVDGRHRVTAAKCAGIDVSYVRVELPHRGYQDLNDFLQSWYGVGSGRIR
ncbi:ParB N-terminal domain-containing protein [Nocardiopsis tropica]|uniref:ParB N-terminal domain-containing protein n=1 Tax=Nocardiopsis tropica TaxID=109330 RepID=UPI0038B2801D